MNKRKRIIGLLLTLTISVGTLLSGCGKSNGNKTQATNLDWTKSSAIYEVNVRQYTSEGTFDAFAKHLDEIKDMGIDILWFMPVHPISETNRSGILGSYYSITDYKKINPEFGTEEDFKELVDLAHEKGFHVMMDWVANHTGWDCAWIKDHPDWYTKDGSGNIISPANMGWPDVADLNYDNSDMRKEMISCMKFWVEEYDIDGFRCDYATGVPVDFWEQAREEIEKVKPVYMLAEDGNTTSLLEKAFDFNYNWGLYDAMVQVAHDNKKASKLRLYIQTSYPNDGYTLNFLDNHDKNSYEGTIIDNFGEAAIPALFAFIYTIPGAPLVYSGDEIGLDQAIAFTAKDPIRWDSSSLDYRSLIKELGSIRDDNKALYCGKYGGGIEYLNTGSDSVLAFERELDGNKIICVFNLSKRETNLSNLHIIDGDAKVLLQGDGASNMNFEDRSLQDGELEGDLKMNPWEYWIIQQ